MMEIIRKNGMDKHSLAADAKFVDYKKGDLRLKKDSPALKLGIRQIDITKIVLKKDPAWRRLKKQGFDKFYGPRKEIKKKKTKKKKK